MNTNIIHFSKNTPNRFNSVLFFYFFLKYSPCLPCLYRNKVYTYIMHFSTESRHGLYLNEIDLKFIHYNLHLTTYVENVAVINKIKTLFCFMFLKRFLLANFALNFNFWPFSLLFSKWYEHTFASLPFGARQ